MRVIRKNIGQPLLHQILDKFHTKLETRGLLSFVGLAIELSIAGSHAAEGAGFQFPRRALKQFPLIYT